VKRRKTSSLIDESELSTLVVSTCVLYVIPYHTCIRLTCERMEH